MYTFANKNYSLRKGHTMKLFKALCLALIINTAAFGNDTQELFNHFHTPLIRAIGDFIDAGAVYHHKTKNFQDTYYNYVFYGTAALLSFQNFAQHNYAIDALFFGSLKGAIGGWIVTYCSWPFYPFASIGAQAHYKSSICENVAIIQQLINTTDDRATLNVASNYLPTYAEGSWMHEQKMKILSNITTRLQEIQLNTQHISFYT